MAFQDRSTGSGFRTRPPMDDWPVLLDTRPNMLVIGQGVAADAFIRTVTSLSQSPVRCLVGGALPPRLPAEGTLILRDVDTLDSEQQERLLRWLDEPQRGHAQLISIAATPLYLLVQAGTFSDQLYYRLNVIHFEVVSE